MARFARFPGGEDLGMYDMTTTRQPGRSHVRIHGGKAVRTTERRKNGLIGHGESDRLVVSLMAGNAAGIDRVTQAVNGENKPRPAAMEGARLLDHYS
jgi:hypothetical protein